MLEAPQIAPEQLAGLCESELRELAARLLARIERHTHEIDWRDAKLEKLAYEIAHLRRMKFGATSEQLNAQQKALFDESVDADIAALEAELEDLKAPPADGKTKARPKRAALPQDLPHLVKGKRIFPRMANQISPPGWELSSCDRIRPALSFSLRR
jgi:transposase